MLDRSKLEPYNWAQTKSFEQLCYQIAKEEFWDKGNFTTMDWSGWDWWVEFYLTLPNWEERGWQCKFFWDNGRLNLSNRKSQIQNSLGTACKKHPKLNKFFLCLKTDFTPDEQIWFETTLKNKVPDSMQVDLQFLGENELSNFLRKYEDIHRYFFTEKLLTWKRFEERYQETCVSSQIRSKYESQLHIPTRIDTVINELLGWQRLIEILDKEIVNSQLLEYIQEYKNAWTSLSMEKLEDNYLLIQNNFFSFRKDKEDLFKKAIRLLDNIKESISQKDEKLLKMYVWELVNYIVSLIDLYEDCKKLTSSDSCNVLWDVDSSLEIDEPLKASHSKQSKMLHYIHKILHYVRIFPKGKTTPQYSPSTTSCDEWKSKARNIIFWPFYALEPCINALDRCASIFELLEKNELHISGDAWMGKTHVSFHIYEDQIKQCNPAIFILAKDLYSNAALEEQLKLSFGVPTNRSFDDLLWVLEVIAKINKIKIPIIIDWLNESTYWNSIWKKWLERLLIKIKQKYLHIVIITTYRTSYEKQLFPKWYFDCDDSWKIKKHTSGFQWLSRDAINNYFDFYKIRLKDHSGAIAHFTHPLYLKLFCETKNLSRKKWVGVSFKQEELFEVFDEYIKQSNENITEILQWIDPRYNIDFTEKKLLDLSECLWKSNKRGLLRTTKLFTDEELRIFEGENLLIFRDRNTETQQEEIQFTYDLLGGYFISKYLIKTYKKDDIKKFKRIYYFFNTKNSLEKFVHSKIFRTRLLHNKKKHPLFDDILRTISVCLIKEWIFLFKEFRDSNLRMRGMKALFEVKAEYIKTHWRIIQPFLRNSFLRSWDKSLFFWWAEITMLDIDNPLNFNFWSDLLKELPMVERDESWSEYVRNDFTNYSWSRFQSFISKFEEVCKEDKKTTDRIHVAAKKVMWVLTTPARKLRDEATRALYFYARKYPENFLNLRKYSIDINDPYVFERMSAVGYWFAMAEHWKGNKTILNEYAKFLYDSMFSPNAMYATTHILTRDYAKRTIDIALLYSPDLLTKDEKKLIQYPLSSYPHKMRWDKDDMVGDHRGAYDGAIMKMDFANYTVGRLISRRGNYDRTNSDYQKVLSNIYRRIFDLWYTEEIFSEIDKSIARRDYFSTDERLGKLDRYGKKYSWIAYFEMAGYRNDLWLLWWDEESRITDVDIDPSFPAPLKTYNILEEYNFFEKDKNTKDWMDNADDLDLTSLLKIEWQYLWADHQWEWVMLKWIIEDKEESENPERDISTTIDMILINGESLEDLKEITDNYFDYKFGTMEVAQWYYTFEGEIPWSEAMAEDEKKSIHIVYNHQQVEQEEIIISYYKRDEKLDKLKIKKLEGQMKALYMKENESENDEKIKAIQLEGLDPIYLFDLTTEEKIILAKKLWYEVRLNKKIKDETQSSSYTLENIETTVFENSRESYHSAVNEGGETRTPSKVICNFNNLYLRPQTSDLYQGDEIISTAFKYGEQYYDRSKFVYIRKESLLQYCRENNLIPVRFQWAEKRHFPGGIKNYWWQSEYKTHCKICYWGD